MNGNVIMCSIYWAVLYCVIAQSCVCSLGAHKLFYTHQLLGCDAHLSPFWV